MSVEAGWETLQEEFKKLIYRKSENHDEMFDNLKAAVVEEVLKKHQWESKVGIFYLHEILVDSS